MLRLCTEITEASLPRVADTGRAGLQVADMRVHLEATRERRTATQAAITGLRLTGATRGTDPTPATGDSQALRLPADQARRVPVATVVAAAASRTDTLRMEHPAVRTVDTLAVDMPAVDTAAVEATVVADTAAASVKRLG